MMYGRKTRETQLIDNLNVKALKLALERIKSNTRVTESSDTYTCAHTYIYMMVYFGINCSDSCTRAQGENAVDNFGKKVLKF